MGRRINNQDDRIRHSMTSLHKELNTVSNGQRFESPIQNNLLARGRFVSSFWLLFFTFVVEIETYLHHLRPSILNRCSQPCPLLHAVLLRAVREPHLRPSTLLPRTLTLTLHVVQVEVLDYLCPPPLKVLPKSARKPSWLAERLVEIRIRV
jgi:hypothetical protein